MQSIASILFYHRQSLYLLLGVVLICINSSARADEWNGPDKTQHFYVSTMLGTAAYAATESRTQAFLFAMAPGVLKEIYDASQPDNHFSAKDLAWDAFGAIVGVQVGFVAIKPNGVSVHIPF